MLRFHMFCDLLRKGLIARRASSPVEICNFLQISETTATIRSPNLPIEDSVVLSDTEEQVKDVPLNEAPNISMSATSTSTSSTTSSLGVSAILTPTNSAIALTDPANLVTSASVPLMALSPTVTPVTSVILLKVATVMPMPVPSTKPSAFTLCHSSPGSRPKTDFPQSRHMMTDPVPQRSDQPIAVPARSQRVIPKSSVNESRQATVTSSTNMVTSNAPVSCTTVTTVDSLEKVSSIIPLDFSMKKLGKAITESEKTESPVPEVINIEPEICAQDENEVLLDLSRRNSPSEKEATSQQVGDNQNVSHKSSNSHGGNEQETLNLTVQPPPTDTTRSQQTPGSKNPSTEKVEIDLTGTTEEEETYKRNIISEKRPGLAKPTAMHPLQSMYSVVNSHSQHLSREKTIFQEVRESIRENIADRHVQNHLQKEHPRSSIPGDAPNRLLREYQWVNQLVEKTERNLKQLYEKRRCLRHDLRIKYGILLEKEKPDMPLIPPERRYDHKSSARDSHHHNSTRDPNYSHLTRDPNYHSSMSGKSVPRVPVPVLPSGPEVLPNMHEYMQHRSRSVPDKTDGKLCLSEPSYSPLDQYPPLQQEDYNGNNQVSPQHTGRHPHRISNNVPLQQRSPLSPQKPMPYRVPAERNAYPMRVSETRYSYNDVQQRVSHEEERPPPPYQQFNTLPPHGAHHPHPPPMLEPANVPLMDQDDLYSQNIHDPSPMDAQIPPHNVPSSGQLVHHQAQYPQGLSQTKDRQLQYPSIQRQLSHPPQQQQQQQQQQEPMSFQIHPAERPREQPARVPHKIVHHQPSLVHPSQPRPPLHDMTKRPQVQYQNRQVAQSGFVPVNNTERSNKRPEYIPTQYADHQQTNRQPSSQAAYRQNYQQQVSRYTEPVPNRYMSQQRLPASVAGERMVPAGERMVPAGERMVPFSGQPRLPQPIPQRRILPKPSVEAPVMKSRPVNSGIPLHKQDDNKKGSCDVCGNSAVYLCSGCKNTWYCTRDCQASIHLVYIFIIISFLILHWYHFIYFLAHNLKLSLLLYRMFGLICQLLCPKVKVTVNTPVLF